MKKKFSFKLSNGTQGLVHCPSLEGTRGLVRCPNFEGTQGLVNCPTKSSTMHFHFPRLKEIIDWESFGIQECKNLIGIRMVHLTLERRCQLTLRWTNPQEKYRLNRKHNYQLSIGKIFCGKLVKY